MSDQFLKRRLSYLDAGQLIEVEQDFLRYESRSIVVLGDAGMGKSTLLGQLRVTPGHVFQSARRFIGPRPPLSIEHGATLVIDALDEVYAQKGGEAVDLVLGKLAELNFPRFILSCRVADWRSATALQSIADYYDAPPLELYLEALTKTDATEYLSASLARTRAKDLIDSLEEKGLSGLWSNPQTLQMIGEVAEKGGIPSSKGELFAEATKILRREHREEKANEALPQLAEDKVLDAAGAAFATLILTGKDAISRRIASHADDLPLVDVATLPGAMQLPEVLVSRLFGAYGNERFGYTHRAIGEFLGARWLARNADTPRKQRRLLQLLTSEALVPASLRGLHAWLAWHSSALATRAIDSDPMGVIEYGDADALNPLEGKTLFDALNRLSQENPQFREFAEYRAGGLVQPALKAEVERVLTSSTFQFGLRLLVLQALKGAHLTPELQPVLLTLFFDSEAVFALRSQAGDRLWETAKTLDWPGMLQSLVDEKTENGARLASELMADIGYDRFSDEQILAMVAAQVPRTDRTVGVFRLLERDFPLSRIPKLLDGITQIAPIEGENGQRRGAAALTDLVLGLLARLLAEGLSASHAAQVWGWVRPFRAEVGYKSEVRETVSDLLKANTPLRRAIQKLTLLDLPSPQTKWYRLHRLCERSTGFALSDDDCIALLDSLPDDDPEWQAVVRLVPHNAERGATVREAALRFARKAEGREEWLAELTRPSIPDWQLENEERDRERQAKREADWEAHRADFRNHLEALKSGDYGMVINPAQAYLGLFYDMDDEADNGPDRLKTWLGPDLRDACLVGFEAFLLQQPPHPSAAEIAASFAESRRWPAGYIIVAALAERLRTGRGFADLPDERLMAGYFELRHTKIDNHAQIIGLDSALESSLRDRGAWEETQRGYFEPFLAVQSSHMNELHELMHDPADPEMADRLATDWLVTFPDIAAEVEAELIDRLLMSEGGQTVLRSVLPQRIKMALNEKRAHNWDAVGIILDFNQTRDRLSTEGDVNPELFWTLRARTESNRHQRPSALLDAERLAWIIETFRPIFPHHSRPDRVTVGNTNPWDGSAFLIGLIRRLGDDPSPSATDALVKLRDASEDEYTDTFRIVTAEQKRKRVEEAWTAADLATVASAVADSAPRTAAQLQTVILEEFVEAQKKVRGSNRDWYKDFFQDSGRPRTENECRTVILKMLGNMPFGIQAQPEGQLADNKRCDILCTLGNLMVPIEVKGQWHPSLWTAADSQLDLLYNNDWRAERGIYLVLWFGSDSAKGITLPPDKSERPSSAKKLRDALAARSATTQSGRTEIIVLDLTRPQ